MVQLLQLEWAIAVSNLFCSGDESVLWVTVDDVIGTVNDGKPPIDKRHGQLPKASDGSTLICRGELFAVGEIARLQAMTDLGIVERISNLSL